MKANPSARVRRVQSRCILLAWILPAFAAGLGGCSIFTATACAAQSGATEPASQAPGSADESVAADLKTITDPTAADDVVLDASVRLSESLEGPLPAETMQALLRLARHPERKVRWNAMGTLGVLGSHAEAAVPELIRIMRESKPDQLGMTDVGLAANALGRIGRRADLAVPALTEALKSSDALARPSAAIALGQFGPDAAPAVPVLVRQMDGADEFERPAFILALGQIGPKARDAGPPLLKRLDGLMNTTDRFGMSERTAVINALGRIHVEAAIPVLTRIVNQGQPADQAAAAYALGRIGPPAKGAIPDLERAAAAGARADLRVPVAFAFVRLGRAGEGYFRLKKMALDDAATLEVFDALVELGPSAVPVLADVIRSDSSNGRWAVQSLEKLGPEGKAAVPALIEVIKSGPGKGSHRFKFDEALVALGKLGADARDAVPTLKELISTTKSESVREAAAVAVRKVENARPATRPTR